MTAFKGLCSSTSGYVCSAVVVPRSPDRSLTRCSLRWTLKRSFSLLSPIVFAGDGEDLVGGERHCRHSFKHAVGIAESGSHRDSSIPSMSACHDQNLPVVFRNDLAVHARHIEHLYRDRGEGSCQP